VKRRLSLVHVRDLARADFRRWALGGVSLAVIAYATLIAVEVSLGGFDASQNIAMLLTLVLCAVALWITARGREMHGAALALIAVWSEIEYTFLNSTIFPNRGMLALPVLVIAAALIVGSRKALFAAIITIVATIVTHRLSPAFRETGFTEITILWFTLHAVSVIGAWMLLSLGIAGFARVFEAMENNEHDLSDTIRFAPDGILVLDGAGHVLRANPAAETLLSATVATLVGRQITDVLRDASATGETLGAMPRDTGESPVSLQFHGSESTPVHVEATWHRMEGDRRQLLLRNVTERVRADEARRTIEAQLAHAQRLEAVGQLAGGLAHDFNNILTAVNGSAELLRHERDPQERQALLSEIVAAGDRGAALTRQLLSFARREVVQPRVLDLSAHVATLRRLLQRVAGDRHQLRFQLTPDCRVRVDIGQIEQALVNLVSNARDAMPDGGTCVVAVERTVSEAGAPRVQLHVSDDGTGMTAEVAARAFEPFFTTKARGQGTGLGLASVHGMAVQSAGSAWITSTPGRGTRVTIDLPYVDEPATAPPLAVSAQAAWSRPYTILLAEDDAGTRSIVERMLRKAGYVVVVAEDGTEALRIVESNLVRIDLLLSDVMMPGHTGPVLAQRVRAMFPAMPVLLMTGYAEETVEGLGDLLFGRDVISKPFSGGVLTTRLAELLGTDGRSDIRGSTAP